MKINGKMYTVGADEAPKTETPVNGGGDVSLPWTQQELIPGVKNTWLLIGIGSALILFRAR